MPTSLVRFGRAIRGRLRCLRPTYAASVSGKTLILVHMWLQPVGSGILLPKLLDLGNGTQFGSVGLIECAMCHHHDFC